MESSPEQNRWKRQYTIAAVAGVLYILLLGIFTYFFNFPI